MSDESDGKRTLERTTSIKLDEGDCTIVVKENGEILFAHNITSEKMNELQIATAGAIIAIASPEWRLKLINLLMGESDEVEMYEVKHDGTVVPGTFKDYLATDVDDKNDPNDFGPN